MSVAIKNRSFAGGLLMLLLAFVLAFVLSADEANAQSAREINNRLSRLENEINTLSRALYRGERPPSGGAASGSGAMSGADVEVRLQQLEHEIRSMRGAMEEQAYEIRQLGDKLERISGDLALRVEDLERKVPGGARNLASNPSSMSNASAMRQLNMADNNAPPPNTLGAIRSTASNDPAAVLYESAFAKIKKSDYEGAEKEFQQFLNQHSDHVLAGNAQYWLGETFYVRGEYERAARIFAEGFQKYPEGSKAADNLLKLGMSLAGMGKKEDACVALQQLERQFSSGAGPVLRRANQEMQRLNCSS